MRSNILVFIVLLGLASPVSPASLAQGGEPKQAQSDDEDENKSYIYEWTDSKGVVHLSDGLGKVPKQYRSSARRVEAPPREGANDGNQMQRDISAPSENSEDEGREADRKEEWQRRMKDAKEKVVELENQYRELDQKRTDLLAQWGGPASGRLLDTAERDRLEQEMKQVQQKLSSARRQVEVVIPEQARKAGVPPGWLRE